MGIVSTTTAFVVSEGHTITKTYTGDSNYMMGASATKMYQWQTDMSCTCGWTDSWNAKISNTVIKYVHNEVVGLS